MNKITWVYRKIYYFSHVNIEHFKIQCIVYFFLPAYLSQEIIFHLRPAIYINHHDRRLLHMSKLTWTKRRAWIKKLRDPYLNFLRNLALQVFLASIAGVLWVKLDFTKFNIFNLYPTLCFYILSIAFWGAVWANASIFLENLCDEQHVWRRDKIKDLRAIGLNGLKLNIAIARIIWKERLFERVIMLIGYCLVLSAIPIVIIVSITATINMLHIMGK